MECAGLPWDFERKTKGTPVTALHRPVTALSVKKTLTLRGRMLAFLTLPGGKRHARHGAGPCQRRFWRSRFDIRCAVSADRHGQCQIQNRTGNMYLPVSPRDEARLEARREDSSSVRCNAINARTGIPASPSTNFRPRDTEWTHRHGFRVPNGDAGRTHHAKMVSYCAGFNCAERVIKE